MRRNLLLNLALSAYSVLHRFADRIQLSLKKTPGQFPARTGLDKDAQVQDQNAL
jgi:hypothetical protein